MIWIEPAYGVQQDQLQRTQTQCLDPNKTTYTNMLPRQPQISPLLRRQPPTILSRPSRRTLSTPKPTDTNSVHTRLRRLNGRLPAFLRTYTTPLLSAPVTHVTSFLLLHEITAVIPLLGLVGAFHYGGWMPEVGDGAFDEGIQRFGRWLRKKGWVEDEERGDVNVTDGIQTERKGKGTRLVVEFATAYAVTKALLPVRVIVSVWATPWFARSVLSPVGKGARMLLGRK